MLSQEEINDAHRKVLIDQAIREYITSKFGDLDKRLLDEEEAIKIRMLLEQDARTQWLWSTARTWLLFIAAAVTGVTLGYEALKSVLKKLVS